MKFYKHTCLIALLIFSITIQSAETTKKKNGWRTSIYNTIFCKRTIFELGMTIIVVPTAFAVGAVAGIVVGIEKGKEDTCTIDNIKQAYFKGMRNTIRMGAVFQNNFPHKKLEDFVAALSAEVGLLHVDRFNLHQFFIPTYEAVLKRLDLDRVYG